MVNSSNISLDAHYFFSCDWGTSAFRLSLINAENQVVIKTLKTHQGIGELNKLYTSEARDAGTTREFFLLQYLQQQIDLLKEGINHIAANIPVIISGMASSSIGIRELPYAPLPLRLEVAHLIYQKLESNNSAHPVYLISGASSESDVMRGEETQLIGLRLLMNTGVDEQLFIFPGTHSKHLYVSDGELIRSTTFMTGELFEVITRHTILKNSIELPKTAVVAGSLPEAFASGVTAAGTLPFSQALFTGRINILFRRLTPADNYYFLSGLIIGEELHSINRESSHPIILSAAGALLECYQQALKTLGFSKRTVIVPGVQAEGAAVAAQCQLYKNIIA